jgi:hypothetical protein
VVELSRIKRGFHVHMKKHETDREEKKNKGRISVMDMLSQSIPPPRPPSYNLIELDLSPESHLKVSVVRDPSAVEEIEA